MIKSNREFTSLVKAGEYPDQVFVPLDEPFINDKGMIENLILDGVQSIARIFSEEGSVRANHYHKTDWHYTFVESGTVRYYWRPVGSQKEPEKEFFRAGEMFFTPPMVEHAMVFDEETVIYTFARNVRDEQHHEEDVVRVNLVQFPD